VALHTKCQIFNPVLISEKDMNWALNYYYGIASREPEPASPPPKKTGNAQAQAVIRRPIIVGDSQPGGPGAPPAGKPEPSAPSKEQRQLQAHAEGSGWSLDTDRDAGEARSAALEREWSFPTEIKGKKEKKEAPEPQARSSAPPKPRRRTGRLMPSRPESKPPVILSTRSAPLPEREPPSKPRQRTASRPERDSWQVPPREDPPPERQPSFSANGRRAAALGKKQEPKPKKLTTGELLHQISAASKRDEIIKAALEFLLHYSERSIFFVVQQERIKGHSVAGEATSREAIRSLWIPANSVSTLREVVSDRQIHYGALGSSPADTVLASALGGKPERALVVPVMIRSRVVGLLYADKLPADPLPWDQLERLTDVVGAAFTGLLKQGGR
jgi:hypothetical protein